VKIVDYMVSVDYQSSFRRCQVPAQPGCAAEWGCPRFLRSPVTYKLSATRSQLLTHAYRRITVEFRYEIFPISFLFREVPESVTSEPAETVL